MRTRDDSGVWVLGLGIAVLVAAWLGPLPDLAGRLFAAHMGMHVAVVAVAAPLIAIGLADTRVDLAAWSPGRVAPALTSPVLASPVIASVAELLVIWAWHTPALHQSARLASGFLVWEQGMFFAAALWVWMAAFGGGRRGSGARMGAGIAALLMTSMHMTLLGALLAVTSRPLYPLCGGSPALTPVQDQQLGGVLMLAFGGISYLAGALVLLGRLLRGAR